MPVKGLLKRFAGVVSASLVGLGVVASPASAREPVPIENWAIVDVMRDAEVSPDGRHLAIMRSTTKDGDPIIEIFDTSDMSKEPRRAGAAKMEMQSLTWLNDDVISVVFRQRVRDDIDGFNQGVYEVAFANLNVPKMEFGSINRGAVQVESFLPSEKDEIIISQPRTNAPTGVEDPFAAFRPREYYRLNLRNGRKSMILKGNDRIATAGFDDEGNPRFATGYDASSKEFVYYYRKPGDTQWEDVYRTDSYDLSTFQVVSFLENDPSRAFVIANNGNDKAGLWIFNMDTGEFESLEYRRADVDVAGVRFHSNSWSNSGEMVGVRYFGKILETEWFDAEEKALYDGLTQAIPNAHSLSVSSRSRDGNTMVVYNQGPKDPGSYYMLRNGQLSFIGSRNPLVKAEDLNPVEYIKYPTRDGREVAAYLTVPPGPGPHPLIVLPHGGPFVSEIVTYDEWGQVLANNGYMVLQPQYRGSLGYGLAHYKDAYGQGGLAMQDDKDDGALWLVRQGRVAADRIAMFGWSYGGYAALVAATREDQIYQCVIPGAGVADPNMQLNYYRDQLLPATEYWEVQRRDGIQPIDEVAKVNVPMLIVHGEDDQRVPFKHHEIYTREMKRKGIPFEELVLEGADHFYNTLFYNHQEQLYTTMLRFLKQDCGPGGL